MIQSIIFDFDHTLFDSRPLDKLREARMWSVIYEEQKKYHFHEGVKELFDALRSRNIKIAIFSNAPQKYLETILAYHQVNIDFMVAYHDVAKHKPAPNGIYKILQQFRLTTRQIVYIGDNDIDAQTARNANIPFYGVEWGTFTDQNINVINFKDFFSVVLDGDEPRKADSVQKHLLDNDPFDLKNIDAYTTENLIINENNQFFLGYYKEPIKNKLLEFKRQETQAIQAWISVIHDNIQALPKVDCIVRALGHDEVEINTTALDQVAELIANESGANYWPDLLQKTKRTQKSTGLKAVQRRNEIRGVYAVKLDHIGLKTLRSKRAKVLIVDDVFTTGATTSEISRAMCQCCSNIEIYIFTLVQTRGFSDTPAMQHHNYHLYRMLELALTAAKKTRNTYDETLYKSKLFSANYSYTNHNFVIQNLFNYSIKADVNKSHFLAPIYILKNILQRGKPTLMSKYLQTHLGAIHTFADFETSHALISPHLIKWHRLIKGVDETNFNPARHFYENLIPKYFGEYSFVQKLIIPELSFYDITQVYDRDLYDQRVDFYIPQAFMIIEIDGSQHENQVYKDAIRDAHTIKYGIETIRIKVSDLQSENETFQEKIDQIVNRLQRFETITHERKQSDLTVISLTDYKQALTDYENSDGEILESSSYIATAVMRMQLLLLEFLENDTLDFEREWKFEIRQYDVVGFTEIAIEDTLIWLHHLFNLHGIDIDKPYYSVKYLQEHESFSTEESIKIDFSLLQRYTDEFQKNPDIVYVRTHYLDEYRYYPTDDATNMHTAVYRPYDYFSMSTLELIKYSFSLDGEDSDKISLLFLLKNIFLQNVEDLDFREGQLGIITNALMGNDTIGLLPTGGGKSICYQLAAILQPAMSFVVCPIKSLMYDQKADLDTVFFSRSNYITSDLKAYEKIQVQKEFALGKYFFIFISPERFQSKAFREDFASINQEKAFAYAVIDEVHCLSEWGHDFRTSYLNLANAIEKFSPDSTYIGLTATASVNVLRDIQTEFGVDDMDVKTPLDYTRKELNFNVIDDRGTKYKTLTTYLKELDERWDIFTPKENESHCGIIFTPHVNGDRGCFDLSNRLSADFGTKVGYYSGSIPKALKFSDNTFSEEQFNIYKQEIQDGYKHNEFTLLAATKAFGMGVNKGNIYYTIHYGIPASMESLYQEAGRAGRDKSQFVDEQAECYVLLTPETNQNVLNNIWDPTASLEELKSISETTRRDGDINTNLFMFVNSLDTINDEFKLIKAVYETYYDDNALIQIVASKKIGANKQKVEKAIYRLSQLGIVSDWTIESFFTGIFEVEFVIHDASTVKEHLDNNIQKYDKNFSMAKLHQEGSKYYKFLFSEKNKNRFSEIETYFIVLLIWSYEHFAYNRRQSLKNIYENCSDLSKGVITTEQFKQSLENYFKFNESSYILQHIADNPKEILHWFSIFYGGKENHMEDDLISVEKQVQIKDQLSRFLESYMRNTGLNFISGMLRLFLNDYDDADGRVRMENAFRIIKNYNQVVQSYIIDELIVLASHLSKQSQTALAESFHTIFQKDTLLHKFYDTIQDEYSLAIILEAQLSRLTTISKQLQETSWQIKSVN